jgi:hypothetical protein
MNSCVILAVFEIIIKKWVHIQQSTMFSPKQSHFLNCLILNNNKKTFIPPQLAGSHVIYFFLLHGLSPRGIRHADYVAPSIRTSWQSLRRQAAVARSV